MLQDIENKINSTSRAHSQRVALHIALTKADKLLHMNPSSFRKQIDSIRKDLSEAAPLALANNPELIITAIRPPHIVGIHDIRNILTQVCQGENVSVPR